MFGCGIGRSFNIICRYIDYEKTCINKFNIEVCFTFKYYGGL